MKELLLKDGGSQEGSTLVVVLLVLVTVTALGVMAIFTGVTEQDVAANDKFHKMAFVLADSTCEMTSELVEQNIEERGFEIDTWGNGGVDIESGSFFMNEEILDDPGTTEIDESLENRPTNTNYDIKRPNDGSGNAYARIYANSALSTGSSLQITSGYDGKGEGVAGGGAQLVFDIRSLAEGVSDSSARVWLRWRHLI